VTTHQAQKQNQQNQQNRGGQRHGADSGRGRNNDRNRQASGRTRTDNLPDTPKSFMGMIKKFFKTLFGMK